MLTTLALFVALSPQTPGTPPPVKKPKVLLPVLGPVVAAGSDPEFQQLVLDVETAMAAKDYAQARLLARQLPRRQIAVKVDYTGIPADARDDVESAIQSAQGAWSGMPGRTTWIARVNQPDVVIRFAPILNTDAESGLPAGSAVFLPRTGPRAEIVIGLQRGRPLRPTTPVAIRNEVGYGIARYFGLSPSPLYGTLASRTDLLVEEPTKAVLHEYFFADANLKVAERLGEMITQRVPIVVAKPSAFLDPESGNAGKIRESLPAPYTFQLTNRGNAPLAYRMVGDCGCVRAGLPGVVAPGATVLLKPYIDTTDFAGELHKRVILYTNDPEMPTRVLPIQVNVTPSYRFLAPAGASTLLGENDNTNIIYLVIPTGSPIKVKEAHLDGVPGTVTMEPWKGSLPDPDLREPSLPREGYRLTVRYEEPFPTTRAPAMISVVTGDLRKPRIRFPVSVQRGIVALPDELYMGTLGSAPHKSVLLVSRPGRPFKVMEATTNHSSLGASFEPLANGDYKITVRYDGKAPSGDFEAVITLLTDDLRQPNVKIPVHGIVQ